MPDEAPVKQEPTLEELVRSAQSLVAADTDAYDRLCELLFARLHAIGMAIVGRKIPPPDVEDVFADVMADFFLYIEKGTPVPYVRGLLNQIGRRRIADYHRAREGAPPSTEFDHETHEHARISDTFDDERIGEVIVNEILEELPSDLHDVAVARFVLDLSVKDTAAELDLTVDVVKKRSQQARDQLRDIARRKGLMP